MVDSQLVLSYYESYGANRTAFVVMPRRGFQEVRRHGCHFPP